MKSMRLFILIYSLIFTGFLFLNVNAEASAVITSHTGYVDSVGSYHVVGEVENTGSTPLIFIRIAATFYDSANQVVGAGFAYAFIQVLTPGAKSPFEVIFTEETQVPKIHHYALNVNFQEAGAVKPLHLAITSHSNYTDAIGILHIVGEVENQGEYTEFVKVIATGYGENGQVVAADFTYTDPPHLSHGQKAPFNLMILSDRAPLVESFTVVAESDTYQSKPIPEFPTSLIVPALLTGVILLLENRCVGDDVRRLHASREAYLAEKR